MIDDCVAFCTSLSLSQKKKKKKKKITTNALSWKAYKVEARNKYSQYRVQRVICANSPQLRL